MLYLLMTLACLHKQMPMVSYQNDVGNIFKKDNTHRVQRHYRLFDGYRFFELPPQIELADDKSKCGLPTYFQIIFASPFA